MHPFGRAGDDAVDDVGVFGEEGAPVLAADHEGLVVKAGDGKITMTDKDGQNEHTHDVDKDAQITCDGKACKLEDLKKGFMVKVSAEKKGDKSVALKIEAKSK